MTPQKYKGAIWTNHAIKRLSERAISLDDAAKAFISPDIQKKGKKKGTQEFIKKLGNKTITLIASQNSQNEWVIISAWIDPPLKGTKDFKKREEYLRYIKSTGLKRLWLTFRRQLGF